MKINKKLSAAITLGLMLGMYGNASAADLYGTDLARDDAISISTAEVERGSTTGVTTDVNKAHNSEHTFTVLSGTWNDIYGGHGAHGYVGNVGANLNSVTIAGSNVKADTVYGGYNTSAKGERNSVTISGTNAEIVHDVYGIYIDNEGLASTNTVNISSGTVGGNVYGGNTGIGNAESNTVKISGSIIGSSTSETGNVYGGWTENGIATNNTIEIKNAEIGTHTGPVTGLVYGGYVKNNGNVTGNRVTVSGTSEIHASVNGGRAAGSKGDAIGNTVNITGTTTKGVYIHAGVTGGFSANGLAKDNLVGTIDNRATNFTAREVHGGYGSTGAEGNDVYLSVGSNVTEDVYGGRTTNGTAGGKDASGNSLGNTVTITGGTVGSSVYGGYSVNGAAINNEVYMSNDSTAAYVFGGYGNTTANGNIVNLAYSNIVSETVGAGNIQGGFGTTGAALNEVTLNNVLASGDVYGGYAKNGNAGGKDASGNSLGNTVTITSGHIGYQYDAEKDEYVGVTIPGGNHLGNVYGGYVKAEGNAENNNVEISDGDIFGGVYGGKTAKGNVKNNVVEIENSTIYGTSRAGRSDDGIVDENIISVSNSTTYDSVTGGNSANGTADKNVVEITDSTIKGLVYGAWSKTGAQENQVSIADSSILHDVYGGYASDGMAKNNAVTISGDSSVNKLVYGGRVYNSGNAENNTVTISGGTFGIEGSLSNDFGNIYGGRVGGNDNEGKAFGEGDAKGNSVSITGGTINGYVYGGLTNEGTAGGTEAGEGNTVSIKGADAANKVTINGRAIGGVSNVDAIGNKVGNSVSDAATNFQAGSVYGGLALGDANKNEVYLGEGAEVSYVIGGYSNNYGTAIDNTVKIAGSAIATDVVGGYSSRRDVGGNTVTIYAGTIGTAGKDDTGNVFGGFSDTGGTVDYYGDAYSNVVNIIGGTIIGKVVGGKTDDGTAGGTTVDKGNQVNISGGSVGGVRGGESSGGPILNNSVEIQGSATKVNGDVYGGYLYHYGNLVSNNVVTIEAGKITGDVFGAYAKNGTVGYQKSSDGSIRGEGNIVEISGGSISGNVYGGKSDSGYANGNKVGTEDAAATSFTAKNVYGGYAGKGVEGNEVWIGTGAEVYQDVMGGFVEKEGEANSNQVTITGGKAYGRVYGGKSEKGDVTSNAVNISGGTIGLFVNGAFTKEGTATKNTVNVSGGTVTMVYGGTVSVGTSSENEVTIENGTVETVICGLAEEKGDATSNQVTITGGTISKDIYGGLAVNGVASNNIVNISGEANTSKANVYGGSGTSAGTGNTLNIDSWNGKAMKSIKHFQAINVKDTRDINVGSADGLAEGEAVLAITDKDLDMAAVGKNEKIVYLTSTGSDDFSTKFSSAKLTDKNNKEYSKDDGLWRATAETYGVDASKAAFQIDEKEAFVSVTDALLAGTFTDNNGNTTSALNADGEYDLTAGAAYEKIYGAYDANGNAQAVTVNLNTAVDLSTNNSTIYGNNVSATGNTLNVRATGSAVGGIEKFENMNFYIPKDAAAGDTLLSVNSDVDLSNVKVAAGFHNDTALGYGDKVILIDAGTNEVSGLDGVSEVKVDDTDFTEYDVMVYQGDASMNQVESGTATTLVAEMANLELKENSKILAETIVAGATVVNDGSDMLASAGFDSATSAIAADLETGAPSGSMSIFGAVSGNKSKVHSGSHIDVKGWNMNLGLAKELKNKDGKMIIGPVVEYGRGDYDSYLDNGYHGEGNSHYVGGGVMAKQINNNGNYFEGSLRGGKLTNEFKSTGGSYDSDVKYIAGHIGLGHVQKMNEKNSMDYYAKYFHTHVADDNITIKAKGKELGMKAESLTSARLRLGTRLNHMMSKKSSYYIGFAWQREFSGTAEAALAGKEIASPSMKGNSGIMELGVKLFDSSRYDLDLGGFGSVGKKEGAGLNFNFNYKF